MSTGNMSTGKICMGDFFINSNEVLWEVIDHDPFHKTYTLRRDGRVDMKDTKERIHMHFERCDKNGIRINDKLKPETMENQNQLQKIKINSEVDAILVSPKMHGTMALVDLLTLKRITSYMKSISFIEAKNNFVMGLGDSENLEQYIGMMKEEINFHESVNLISTIEIPELKQEEIKTSIH